MEPASIRSADPTRDAAACVAIYAPHIEAGATSFEEEPPGAAAFAERMAEEGQPPEPLPPHPYARLRLPHV